MTTPTGRNQIIDAYRGIAILMVLAFHYTVRWPDLYGFDRVYPGWFELGAYGVHLFFVVSGLVITMTVLRSRGALHFGVRRFGRLYPALLVAALLTFTLNAWGPESFHRSRADLLASLTMDAKLFGQRYVDGAYWSLAVEARFYVYVAIAWACLKERFWIGVLALAAVASLPLGSAWTYLLIANWWPYLLAGMAGWYGIFERRVVPAACLGAMAAILYVIHRPGDWLVDAGLAAAVLAFLGLLWRAPDWQPAAVRALAWVGGLSYSLYLLHQNLGVTVIGYLTKTGLSDLAAILVASVVMVALAHVSYRHVEKPGARLVMSFYERWRVRGWLGLPWPWIARDGNQARGAAGSASREP